MTSLPDKRVTEETDEIFHLFSVVDMFLKHNIRMFDLQDIQECAEELAGVKVNTVDRWLANPLFTKTPSNQNLYGFKYGRNPNAIFGTHPFRKLYGFEYALNELGIEFYVKWSRVWSLSYARGFEPTCHGVLTHREKIEEHLRQQLAYSCRLYDDEWEPKDINNYIKGMFVSLLRSEYEYRGHPNLFLEEPTIGRKAIVKLSRNTVTKRIPKGHVPWGLPKRKGSEE